MSEENTAVNFQMNNFPLIIYSLHRKDQENLPLKSSLSLARSLRTADVTCFGSISLKRGRWSLFNMGLSNNMASVVVIFKWDAAIVDFDRTADRNDPERRPTDLTAKLRDSINEFAKHKVIKMNDFWVFINDTLLVILTHNESNQSVIDRRLHFAMMITMLIATLNTLNLYCKLF